MADTPKPPPGFVLVPATAMPSPPPGFVLVGQEPPTPARPVADVIDAPMDFVRGFNKGAAELVSLPYRAIDGLLENVTGGKIGLPDVGQMPAWRQYLEQPEPSSQVGDYVRKAGEGVGASVVPMMGAFAKAGQAAVPAIAPATSTMGAIGQQLMQQIRANPGAIAAAELASGAGAGIGQEAAQDAGFGPVGQTIGAMVGGMAPGALMAYRNPAQTPIGTPTGRRIADERLAQAQQDVAAFERQGVRPFGPAFNEGPVASVGKQFTETAIVGAPLKNNLDETFVDVAAAARRMADSISPAATLENAGLNVQRGLDRFRDRSFTELEPGVVQGLGINPMSPVQRAQGGGQAQIQRIQQGMPLVQQITGGQVQNTRGQPVPLPQTRIQKLATRTTLEDLSDGELNTVIRTPADQTSFSTRLEALYERAWRAVPNLLRSNGTANPNLLPTANAGRVVREIVGDEARTGVRAGLQGRYGEMFDRLANPAVNVPLADLRAMRTAIGRDLSNFGMYDATLDRTQLRRLYAGLSSDIEVGLQDLAVRAAMATQAGGNRQLNMADARRAAQALRDMQLADRYARQGFERMDRFLQTVRQPNPQQAAVSLIRAATDGSAGNMRQFRAAMSVLRPEERAEFGALITRQLGEPTPGARGITQEAQFSPTRFATNYQRLSPEARAMIFTPQHHRALEDLYRVANRIANVEAMTNTSRSGTNAMNMGLLGGAGAALTSGVDAMLTFGGTAAGMAAASALMSRPAYARWMVNYMQLRANVRAGTDRAVAPLMRHVARLTDMSASNPALLPAVLAVTTEVKGIGGPKQ